MPYGQFFMLSRGHPCLRRRGLSLSAVWDNVAATTGVEEPLLFLYPRWVGQARRGAVRSVNTASAAGYSCSCPRFSRLLPALPSTRWFSSSSAVEAEGTQDGGGYSEEGDHEKGGMKDNGAQAAGGGPRGKKTMEKKRPFNVFADIETTKMTTAPAIASRNERPKISTSTKTHSRPLMVNRERSSAMAKRLNSRDVRKLCSRFFMNKMLKGKRPGMRPLKWDHIKELLERNQQETRVWTRRAIKHRTLLVPEETVALLAGITDMAMKENIWFVPVHNGCRIHVLHPSESEGHFRKVVVSGSTRVVELVSERIMHVQSLQESGDPLVDVRKPPVPVYPSIEALKQKRLPIPRVRGVWDFYERYKRPLPIEEVLDRPDPVTVREFLELIEDLIESRMSGPYRRQKTHRQMPHVQQVAKVLVGLFCREENFKLISTAALNQAVSFLCKHELLRPCRTVFIRCEHVVTVETFNILLRKCAERQDIRTFRNLVVAMSRMNIRPDSYTWVALLDCLASSTARSELFFYMIRRHHISQIGPMRTALQTTIQDTFLEHLRSGQDVDSFLELLQETQGANWFSSSMLNKMFNATVTLKDYPAMNRLLDICDEQGINIDSTTLRRILPSFRANIFWALIYVYRYINRPGFQLDRETWEKLFLIAFKGRNYNLCRVFWRYACMSGTTTYKMKMTVLSSLTTNIAKKKTASEFDNVWRSNAGKIIVGVDLRNMHHPAGDLYAFTPYEFHENPVVSLMTGYQDGEERSQQLQLAHALVRRDIEVGRLYRPVVPLGVMLDAAALVDLEWKGVPRPPQWMMDHSIQVRVEWRGYLKSP